MQISEHIHALHIPFFITLPSGQKLPRSVYAYLILGEQTGLVDSGVAGSECIILDYLKGIDGKGSGIDKLIFTHSHPDHIGGAKTILAGSTCETAAHELAKAWIEDIDLQFTERPVPGFHLLVAGSVPVHHVLKDSETVELGGVSLITLHTPGHSKDSISLFCPEDGVLLSGDAVPQPGDLPIYEDPLASVQSLARMAQRKDIKALLSSWCSPAPQNDPYLQLEEGRKHLQRIHDTIRSRAGEDTVSDPMTLCREMVKMLGLPVAAVNPLVAKSFAAHLSYLDMETL